LAGHFQLQIPTRRANEQAGLTDPLSPNRGRVAGRLDDLIRFSVLVGLQENEDGQVYANKKRTLQTERALLNGEYRLPAYSSRP
jgi:hypothetical protein